jgi:hypothetical protein
MLFLEEIRKHIRHFCLIDMRMMGWNSLFVRLEGLQKTRCRGPRPLPNIYPNCHSTIHKNHKNSIRSTKQDGSPARPAGALLQVLVKHSRRAVPKGHVHRHDVSSCGCLYDQSCGAYGARHGPNVQKCTPLLKSKLYLVTAACYPTRALESYPS